MLCDMSDLTELGRLLEGARKRRRLSQNAAAALAGISGTHWRRVVRGAEQAGTAETNARMAQAVGVTPAQLDDIGRPDIGAELRILEHEEPPPTQDAQDVDTGGKTLAELLAEAERTMDRIEELLDERDRRQMEAIRAMMRTIVDAQPHEPDDRK